MSAVEHEPRTYGNFRRPRSSGLGALGMISTIVLFTGFVVIMLTLMFLGPLPAVAVGVVLALGSAGLLVRDRHGRTALQQVATRIGGRRARKSGTHLYRSGPLGRTPWGRYQLPGLAAASELSEHSDAYGRRFAILTIPTTRHHTVLIEVAPDGASLVDPEQVDRWVAHWGAWKAKLGNQPGVVAASVTVETSPDSGYRLRREVEGHIDPDASPIALAMMREVVDNYPQGSATIRVIVAITFSAAARLGAKNRPLEDVAKDLGSRLPGLTQSLLETGAGAPRLMTAQEVCEFMRVAYDPPAARLIDFAREEGESPDLRWGDVGPTSHRAYPDCYRHDGSWSVTWAMSSPPRGQLYSSVLTQMLAPHQDLDRKRVTLLFQPMDAATSARIVEQDLRNADFRVSSTKRPSARLVSEQRAARQNAEEEAAGAALVDFGMVVTATVSDQERLHDARAAVENLGGAARLHLRLVRDSQDSAFAAGLPLGLVLPDHLRVPNEIRKNL